MFEFNIKRASDFYEHGEKKPCKEAVREGENWKIRFETPEDLRAFVSREGEIIISEDDGELEILIYDDYIE